MTELPRMGQRLEGLALDDLGWRPTFEQQLGSAAELGRVYRVVAVHRNGFVLSNGAEDCALYLGRYWFRRPTEERPTVGDWVVVDECHHRIERCLKRDNILKRVAAGDKVDTQLIGANVDVLFVVSSCNLEFNPERIQRFLALATSSSVAVLIVLTKADLAADAESFRRRAQAVRAGVPVTVVNALDPTTLVDVRRWLGPARTAALLGSSGVGKSTLLNTLAGREVQVTQPIREQDARGRHTTTSRSLLRLPNGALFLDGPGVRELGMAVAEEHVNAVFEDIQAIAARCRFRDCRHRTEPGCAVSAAVQSGRLGAGRVQAYVTLLAERDRHAKAIKTRDERSQRLDRRRQQRRVRDDDEPVDDAPK